jgi:sugar phosphate isomerase/epimerase
MHKLAFSTLSCPKWDIRTIVDAASANGYHAIDFRGYQGVIEVIDSDTFKGNSLKEIASIIHDSGIEVSCLSSGAKMSSPTESDRERSLEMIKRYIELCHGLNSKMIRIFGGRRGTLERPVENAAETLVKAAELASKEGVTIAVETHDDWTKSDDLLKVFEAASFPDGAAFLWDIHHPYRFNGETPSHTAENFKRCLANTHWKDSLPNENGKHTLKLCGSGDIPLAEAYKALQKIGYQGYLTLEWEKVWHPDIEEPEIAIPQFATFIRNLSILN